MPKKTTLEGFADEKAHARFAENQELAREARAARAEARDQKAAAERLEKELGLYRALKGMAPVVPSWLTPTTPRAGHRAIPTLVVCDAHYGEVVDPGQIEGLNAYNVAIAFQRLKRAFTGAVMLCRDYMKGVAYDGANLMLPGDLISGDIHEELRETNELTVAEMVVGILEPLEAGINLLAREFGRVHVAGVPGNHPRGTKKPVYKNRARDNFDTLIYRLLQRDYKGDAKVTVAVADGADLPVQVYGTRYLLTHGDQFHGGSGISGVLAPLLLGTHRKTRRAASAGRPYDQLVMGHFHQSLWFPSKGLIVSGCVKGYDELAYIANYEPEPAQCALWLTTPERGIINSMPVFVQDRKAEGW